MLSFHHLLSLLRVVLALYLLDILSLMGGQLSCVSQLRCLCFAFVCPPPPSANGINVLCLLCVHGPADFFQQRKKFDCFVFATSLKACLVSGVTQKIEEKNRFCSTEARMVLFEKNES
jgi:hypothetical protein